MEGDDEFAKIHGPIICLNRSMESTICQLENRTLSEHSSIAPLFTRMIKKQRPYYANV
jgi:hypothetical protein